MGIPGGEPGEAQIRIAVGSDRGEADLLIDRVGSKGLAYGEAGWIQPSRYKGRFG
jgi:hypothetical protein